MLPIHDSKLKFALGIEYDGSAYYGWQRQQSMPSIQSCLERALSIVADEPITVYCAGRTDAGAHATGQVVHFYTRSRRPENAWTLGVNANLPIDIAVQWAMPVEADFHARFSAIARRYRYIICDQRLRPALFKSGMAHYYRSLDVPSMARASHCLLGENDFTSFRALQCQSRTPWRNIHHLRITRCRQYVILDIKANSFVHHMVRNIVGSLIEIGCGNQPETWLSEILASRDRMQAGPTAPADGLYLVAVEYPSRFTFPQSRLGPLFLIE